MERRYAEQIADLLNRRNQLVVNYNAEKIIKYSDDYIILSDKKDKLIGAVKVKQVQWYQWQLCHLTVSELHEGKGYGTLLLKNAEKKLKKQGALIIQCTIREDNERSKILFSKNDYKNVSTFYYPLSGNNVGVWQKVISQSTKS